MGVVVLFLFHYQGDSPQSLPFPVVDRPCLVLVRHCRKKKNAGSGAGPVDVHQASTHMIDPPHSATGERCDQSFVESIHAFVDCRCGRTQKVKRVESAQDDGEEVRWCKGGRRTAPHKTLFGSSTCNDWMMQCKRESASPWPLPFLAMNRLNVNRQSVKSMTYQGRLVSNGKAELRRP